MESGSLVEAIKPGGNHFWRAARLHVKSEGNASGTYQVRFTGDKKVYSVPKKNVRKRKTAMKKNTLNPKSSIAEATVVVVDLTEVPSDKEDLAAAVRQHFENEEKKKRIATLDIENNVNEKQLIDPYLEQQQHDIRITSTKNKIPGLISEDPYALDSPEPAQTAYYASSFIPVQYPAQPQPPLVDQTWNHNNNGNSNHNYNNRRKRGKQVCRRQYGNSWYKPANESATNSNAGSYNNNITYGGYQQEQAMNFPGFDMGTSNNNSQLWSNPGLPAPPEEETEVVQREPGVEQKVAREQLKLGIGKDLAKIAVPRKPLPRWLNSSRMNLPRMSLGGGAREKAVDQGYEEAADDVNINNNSNTNSNSSTGRVASSEAPRPLKKSRKKKKKPVPREPQQRIPRETPSSSTPGTDSEEVLRGPRLSQRQRVLARKRKASALEDAARTKQQRALAANTYQRKKPRLVRASKKFNKVNKRTKFSTTPPLENRTPLLREIAAKTRGNGRRKSTPVRRNMGARRLEILNSVDRFVANEYVGHTAKFTTASNNDDNGEESGENNKHCTSMVCADFARKKYDAVIHCNLCGNAHHKYCSGIKTFANPLLCGKCVELIIRGYKKTPMEGSWTRGRRKWLVSVGISPLVQMFQEVLRISRPPPRLRNNVTEMDMDIDSIRRRAGRLSIIRLAPEEKIMMAMNVEDMRRGIIKKSVHTNSVSKLTYAG